MYDTSFDHASSTSSVRVALWLPRLAAVAAIVGIFAPGIGAAQMTGTPVLQNAWATPGIVGAVNVGGGSDGTVYAAAASWTPGMGRFQISGGVGRESRTGGQGKGAVYGARVAIPLGGAASSFGFGAFVGVGGGGSSSAVTTVSGATVVDSSASTVQIPVGAAIGWRHAIGATHGISVYATPAYVFFTGGSSSGGVFRAAIGADAGITSSIGATAGVDFGQSRGRGIGGPSGARYGLGVSYAFGHHSP